MSRAVCSANSSCWLWSATSAFIVDGDGKIAKLFPKVSPKTHDDIVLKALAEL